MFPTTPVRSSRPSPAMRDAFVSKFNPAGTALIYSTFLGGTEQRQRHRARPPGRIAADAAGNAYIAGDTSSADFPVSGNAGGRHVRRRRRRARTDAFYVKLGPTGAFLYGTFIGGSDYDWATGIAVDAAGNVYVSGGTTLGRRRWLPADRPTPTTRRLERLPTRS